MGQRGSGACNPSESLIYSQNLLPVKILFENVSDKPIFGVYRPSAYMKETGTFFTTLRLDILKKEVEPGKSLVMTGTLDAPAGFGHHLKVGALLSVRVGLEEQGRAIVLDIG